MKLSIWTKGAQRYGYDWTYAEKIYLIEKMVTHIFLVNDDLLYSLILSEIIHSANKERGQNTRMLHWNL